MKQSTKAALLSGLVLPGLGQLAILKRPKRGLLFLIPSVAALIWLMNSLSTATEKLLTEAASGTMQPDPVAVATRLAESSDASGASLPSAILLICWLAALIDALSAKD
ncbi:hypothetical protein [Pseudoduganella sp. OTU4001]|uniref:hypothetical protein n=1 Tax=Pseudoduganella sp. OTU4001 TaxID=3043854 RepID=UPI00313F1844